MVEYSTALHFPALVVMSVPVTSVLHFILLEDTFDKMQEQFTMTYKMI